MVPAGTPGGAPGLTTDPNLSAIEMLIVRLGAGDDVLEILGTPTGAPEVDGLTAAPPGTTLVQGGGNTPGGGDVVLVTGAAPASTLAIYGDTTADGRWYARSALDLGPRPFGGAGDVFLLSGATTFAAARIRRHRCRCAAAAPGEAPVRFIAYGGAWDDLIIGSQDADLLAGGIGRRLDRRQQAATTSSSATTRVDVDVLTQVASIVIAASPPVRCRRRGDTLLAGIDEILRRRRRRRAHRRPGPAGHATFWYSVDRTNGVADLLDGGAGDDS